MKETFLGTGANGGLPQIDCSCLNCVEAEKNHLLRRLRSCVWVESSKGNVILDCGPDIRRQLLTVGLTLRDLRMIAITHLHFDHAGGLMELSAGKPWAVPVLVNERVRQQWRNLVQNGGNEIAFLVKAGFMKIIDDQEGLELGVRLVDVPHDPKFPTSGIVVDDGISKIWYSPDISQITDQMLGEIRSADVAIIDGTFLNEEIYQAPKYNHTTIERSAERLEGIKSRVIFSHINHSESRQRISGVISKCGFILAEDGDKIGI